MIIPRERRAILTCFSAALLGQFAAGLGAQMVSTALPDIQGSIGASSDEASWISTAYAIGEIVTIPIAGMLLQLVGLRRYMGWLSAVFIVTALASALVRSLETEIALRALQGMAGGAFGVAAFGLTFRAFGGRNIAFGLALLIFAQTFPANLGAILAGYLTATDAGWPAVYFVEIGLALIVFFEASTSSNALPAFNWQSFRAADWIGYALLASGLGLTIAGLSQGARRFWWDNDVVLATLGLGLGAIAAFIALEWGRRDGIVDFGLLRRRSFGAAILLNIFFRCGLLTTGYLDPQFLGQLAGYRSLETARVMVATAVAQVIAFPMTYWLVYRIPPRTLIFAGLVAFALGPLLLLSANSQWSGEQFLIAHAILGAAAPLFLIPLLVIGTRDVKPSEGASASTFFNGSRAVAQQLGTAILATLIRTREQFHSSVLTESLNTAQLAASSIPGLVGRVRGEAFNLAYADCFAVLAVLLGISAVLTVALPAAPPVSRLGAGA